MTAAVRAQMKVAEAAEELFHDDQLVDLKTPHPERGLSFDDAMAEIEKRYSVAIDLLGKL
ncbi:hypothetical protein PSU4_30050 [Pseudonocardia sulfidoxydans NBRC 16205]|uniref:Uncharacterized protein n=2 Tax=Pseudonocardia sulfidoxydans TaxID=54011 RepID=A0A511DGZ1_9PSEU|nr:hypothetical protein [Pseudonocardia sulfidoxydans]GEL24051.1 hypothetical protein PSU4_30050 [Pseudonocardia sulfidoxydans NBRC 16205]